ncbi:MAG TPA: ATP-binding protein [Candidatus Eisenbacteria bacterium]|nr:ATP-binding protein [Candidatus Eisenbacteria bacterium]
MTPAPSDKSPATARTIDPLFEENQQLRVRLNELEDAIRAVRAGEVDAVLVTGDQDQVFTLETADKPYRLLVEQMPQGAATLTTDGIILYGNGAFADLLQQPLNMLVGKSILDLAADDQREGFASMLDEATDVQVRRQIGMQRGDGVRCDVYFGVSALHEGALGECLVIIDLSEQRHYRDLQRAQEALREADRRKDEFLAILSHELRNPLGPIRNAAHFLKLKGPQEAELRHPIEMIERQTDQMVRLIDDLLDVSRISRGVLELRRERLLLADIVEQAVDACRDDLRARRHNLRVSLPSDPVELDADHARLVQVLCNLIGNAAKYTPAGGHIDVRCVASDHTLELSVKDDGIGIPAEKLGEIFELFAQVDRSTDREGGLGIGLTLVREIVRLHGGSIEARSDGIGHGSEFVVRLPVIPTEAAPISVAATGGAGPAVRPRRILIADDNHDAVESLSLLLQMSGHEVHKAFDGESALAVAQQVMPDVIVLDIGMPKVNGYEVAKQVRAEPWGRRTFLVALTGWGYPEDRRRTRDAGFDAHLVKPVNPAELELLLTSIDVQQTTRA